MQIVELAKNIFLCFYEYDKNLQIKIQHQGKVMNLKIFNFTKDNVDRMMNYNKPIKRSIEIPNNTFVQEKSTVCTKLVKITDLILKKIARY